MYFVSKPFVVQKLVLRFIQHKRQDVKVTEKAKQGQKFNWFVYHGIRRRGRIKNNKRIFRTNRVS